MNPTPRPTTATTIDPRDTGRSIGRTATALLPAGIWLGVVSAACNPSTARPSFSPMAAAIVDTVLATPEAAIDAVHRRLIADTVRIRTFHALDGYVETRAMTFAALPDRTATVTLRVWADPLIGRRARITAEVVFQWTADPSRIPRERERQVSRDHPAHQYITDILRAVRESFDP